jgi:cell division protein FtsN
MSRWISLVSTVIVVFSGLISGCSSAETGASNRAIDPQREMVPPSVAEPALQPTVRPETTIVAPKRTRSVPRVRSSKDTVRAATARKTRQPVRPAALVKPANAMYTVQVGAFARASNALRLQRSVKRQFSTQPVYNDYHAVDKLYRVTIGRFSRLSDASALRRRLIASDSIAFGLCWVTYKKP